jgi:hypothetical protein
LRKHVFPILVRPTGESKHEERAVGRAGGRKGDEAMVGCTGV